MNAVSLTNAAPVSRLEGKLRVGGVTSFSATDYPGKLSAVVFCQGCPWRCRYCHNPHLLPRRGADDTAWTDVLAFLGRRRRLLDAVVFSGGEPTLQAGLPAAMRDVKALGFLVGLHTAGIAPPRLAQVLPLLDWVGMDVKAPFDRYDEITGIAGSGACALASARLILASGVSHEFRTTVHRALLSREELAGLARTVAALGARRYALQEFRADGCRAPDLAAAAAGYHFDESLTSDLRPIFETLTVRPA